jgi:hypothetical protein
MWRRDSGGRNGSDGNIQPQRDDRREGSGVGRAIGCIRSLVVPVRLDRVPSYPDRPCTAATARLMAAALKGRHKAAWGRATNGSAAPGRRVPARRALKGRYRRSLSICFALSGLGPFPQFKPRAALRSALGCFLMPLRGGGEPGISERTGRLEKIPATPLRVSATKLR